MPDLFGAPAGISQALQDQGQIARTGLEGLATLETMGRLQMLPTQMEMQRVQLGEAQEKLDLARRQRAFRDLPVNQMGAGATPEQMSNHYWQQAGQAADMGLYTESEGLARMAMGIDAKVVHIDAERELADARHERTAKNIWEDLNKSAGGIYDQKTLGDWNREYYVRTGKVSPWAYRRYTPQLNAEIDRYFMTANERMTASRDAERDRRAQINMNSEIQYRNWRMQHAENVEADRKAAAERKQTIGGLSFNAYDPKLNTIAMGELRKSYPGLSNVDLETASHAIAVLAKNKQIANRALDSEVAVRQAMADRKIDFEHHSAGMFSSAKDAYTQPGSTKQNPLPFPATPDALIDDMFYRKDGKLIQIVNTNGKQMWREVTDADSK